jgi:hypothetical protein
MRLCKFRKDCLTDIGHGAMMFAAVLGICSKTPPCLHFQLSKDEEKGVEFDVLIEAIMFYIF